MRITALQPQANNSERINIFVDGHFLLGVHAMIVLQMGLAVEQELTQEQVEQLRSEEALQQAVDQALHYLSYRPRSREEVRRYLQRKATALELVDVVLAHLDELNLVNDHDFASFWLETREHFSPRGAYALKNELRQKGVLREIIDEVIDDEDSEQDEERALRAARKKATSLAQHSDVDYAKFRARLGAYLQRRGFSYEVTTRTVKALWNELRQEDIDQ